MLKLYFANAFTIISTLLIAAFAVFFGMVTARRAEIVNWGLLTLAMFLLGLSMSMMSGMKDGMGTAASIIPNNNWVMIALCALGALAFLCGIAALIVRKQVFWEITFFALSAIILLKTLLTEAFRIIHYLNK